MAAWTITPGVLLPTPVSLPRAALDLATLALRARKGNLATLAPLGQSHGTLTAQWWSRSLVPQGRQGRMEPLAGTASP